MKKDSQMDVQKAPTRRGHFLLGNMLAVQRNPTGFLLSLRREYGDFVRYPVAIWRDLYLLSHPDAVRHVLVTNHFASCPLGGKKLLSDRPQPNDAEACDGRWIAHE